MKVKELLERTRPDISIEFTKADGEYICSTTKESEGIIPFLEKEIKFWEVRQYHYEVETHRNTDIHIALE